MSSLPTPCRPSRRGLLAAVATGALLLSAPASLADQDTPLPFGLRLADPQTTLPMDKPVAAAVPAGRLSALAAAQERLATLESVNGPYDAALGPELVETAELAASAGQLELATELYAWALHNVRVNEGLSSDNQLALVEALLQLHRRAGDLAAMDDREGYLYRLQGNGRPPWTEAKLRAALRYLQWRQLWLVLQDASEQERALADLHTEGDELIDAVCEDAEVGPTWCPLFAVQALGTLYLIDYHVEPDVRDELNRATGRFAMPPSTVDWQRSVSDERLLSIERSAYATGRRLLEQALEVAPTNPQLKLALADWHWFQRRFGAARRAYRDLVIEDGLRLDAPVALPQQPLIGGDMAGLVDTDTVRIVMTVTAAGRASQVEFAEGDAVDEGLRIRTRRAIREMRFRPAIDAQGEAVDAAVEFTWIAWRQ